VVIYHGQNLSTRVPISSLVPSPSPGYYEVFLTLIAEIATFDPSIAMLLMVEHSMNQLRAAYLRLIYPFSLYPFLYPDVTLSQAFLPFPILQVSWERGKGIFLFFLGGGGGGCLIWPLLSKAIVRPS